MRVLSLLCWLGEAGVLLILCGLLYASVQFFRTPPEPYGVLNARDIPIEKISYIRLYRRASSILNPAINTKLRTIYVFPKRRRRIRLHFAHINIARNFYWLARRWLDDQFVPTFAMFWISHFGNKEPRRHSLRTREILPR